MIRKALILLALIVLIAASLYQFAGLRIALDGTGRWPRFIRHVPDYDALEADRARQRDRFADAPAATSSAPPAAGDPVAQAVTSLVPQSDGSGPNVARAGYWPDFRGPNRDGRYTDAPIRT